MHRKILALQSSAEFTIVTLVREALFFHQAQESTHAVADG